MEQLTLLALIVAILAALQTLLMKHLTQKYSTETVFALFSVIYFLLTLFYIHHHRNIIKGDIGKLMGPGLVLIIVAVVLSFIGNSLYHSLLSKHDAGVVSALVSVTPLIIVIISLFVMHQTITSQQMLGIGAIVAGVLLVS